MVLDPDNVGGVHHKRIFPSRNPSTLGQLYISICNIKGFIEFKVRITHIKNFCLMFSESTTSWFNVLSTKCNCQKGPSSASDCACLDQCYLLVCLYGAYSI